MSLQGPIYARGTRATQTSSEEELEKLDQLAKEREEERKRREEKQREIEAARAEAEAQDRALQQEIEGLLSSDPREFVIRFLQTEGQ